MSLKMSNLNILKAIDINVENNNNTTKKHNNDKKKVPSSCPTRHSISNDYYSFLKEKSDLDVQNTLSLSPASQLNKMLIEDCPSVLTHLINYENLNVPLPLFNYTDFWMNLKKKEKTYKFNSLYLFEHPKIKPKMRAILIDWLIDISSVYLLQRETVHLAINYIDRFMSATVDVQVDRLQLIGITALFIAAKTEEVHPPSLIHFARHIDNYSNKNEQTISEFELYMLKTLKWNILPKTSNSWLNIYLQISSYTKYKQFNMSQRLPEDLQNSYVKIMTLIDLCLFDIQSLGHDYSKIAAAAMYHLMSPNHLALFSSGFRFGEIKQTVDWMSPYADAIRNIEETIKIKRFSKIDLESCHNIQLNCQYLELLENVKACRLKALENLSTLFSDP